MDKERICEIEKNAKLKNKLLNLGLGYSIVGPTGPRGMQGSTGPTGPAGPVLPSITIGSFQTGFLDTKEAGPMVFENSWFIPNQSEYFTLVSDDELKISPGIYEITLSGFISGVDIDHGVEIYLKNQAGDAIKDLHFKLLQGSLNQTYFSQTIFFRFESEDYLQLIVNIIGDIPTSNAEVSSANLLLKRIYE